MNCGKYAKIDLRHSDLNGRLINKLWPDGIQVLNTIGDLIAPSCNNREGRELKQSLVYLAMPLLFTLFTNSSYAGSFGYAGSTEGHLIRASYYSSGYRTASGEHFNPNGFTAAHRTLPFGTRLSVTNPANGRTVVVRINDRGPFVRGVSLDLARGAAFALGMRGNGTVRIAQLGGETPYSPDEDAFSGEGAAEQGASSRAWRSSARDAKDATRFWGSPFEHALD
jgi:rare lipoprotein A